MFGIDGELAVQLLVTGVSVGAVYGLIAVGFGLVFRASGLVNVLSGEFLVIGALVTGAASESMPLVLAGMVGILVTMAAAEISYDGFIRPVLKRADDHSAGVVVQMGLLLTIVAALQRQFGTAPRTIPPFSGYEPLNLFGATVPRQTIWIIAMLIAQVVALRLLLFRTWPGMAMRATASNPVAAKLVGMSPQRVTRSVFLLAALVAALAGIVVAPATAVQFDSGLPYTLSGFIAAIMGGFGSITGALLGGILLGEIQSFASGSDYGRYRDVIVFGVLILVLIVRPGGLFSGRKQN